MAKCINDNGGKYSINISSNEMTSMKKWLKMKKASMLMTNVMKCEENGKSIIDDQYWWRKWQW